MIFRINFELENGENDYIFVTGETIEEIREKVSQELALRGGKNPWSELVE